MGSSTDEGIAKGFIFATGRGVGLAIEVREIAHEAGEASLRGPPSPATENGLHKDPSKSPNGVATMFLESRPVKIALRMPSSYIIAAGTRNMPASFLIPWR